MSSSLRVTRTQLEARLEAVEAALVEARRLIDGLAEQAYQDAKDADALRAGLQAVGSALAMHAADERRHTGAP